VEHAALVIHSGAAPAALGSAIAGSSSDRSADSLHDFPVRRSATIYFAVQ
jgi:hypothetical protein